MTFAKIAIFLLWMAAVFDPIGDVFYLRYVALGVSLFTVICLLGAGKIGLVEKSYRWSFIVLLAVIMPLYGLVLYSFRAAGADFIDTSYIASGALILTSLLYTDYESCLCGISALIISTRLLSLVILAAFVSQAAMHGEWISFFIGRNVAFVTFRDYAGISMPYIYFFASPLLILLLAYDFQRLKVGQLRKRLPLFVLTSIALGLSGTRAHVIIAILFAPIFQLLLGKRMVKIIAMLTMAVILILVLAFDTTRGLLIAYVSPSEASNSIKINMLRGYSNLFSDPVVLLFGQGFNAHEWSPELRGMISMEANASKTELTYIELIRVYGVVLGSVFISTLVLFVHRLKKLTENDAWLYVGFVIFLIDAVSNPYLFSTNGMLPLGLTSSLLSYTERKRMLRRPL